MPTTFAIARVFLKYLSLRQVCTIVPSMAPGGFIIMALNIGDDFFKTWRSLHRLSNSTPVSRDVTVVSSKRDVC